VKDEFTLKFLFFNKLPRDVVLEYLRSQQLRTAEQRDGFQRALDSTRGELDFFLQAIIRKGIVHLEAEIRWLEEVVGELQARP
jgi:hypothetical protein